MDLDVDERSVLATVDVCKDHSTLASQGAPVVGPPLHVEARGDVGERERQKLVLGVAE